MSFDESLLPPAASAYLDDLLAPPYPAAARMEAEIRAEGQPAVGRQTGALLRSYALSLRAERILEVGTNLGYSGLWMCAGLAPNGRFEGIEIDDELAGRAEASLGEAIGKRASVHLGAALDVLAHLPEKAYDLIFIDAVKAEYPQYLEHALRLVKPGGIIAADNMFWRGAVWDKTQSDPDTLGVREYTRRIFSNARLASAIVPVEDGLGVSVVRNA